MRPEGSAEYLCRLVAIPLSDAVDAKVAQTVARLRAVFYYGLFDYDLFTAASDLAYLSVEGALRRRFMIGYGGRIAFVGKDHTEYVEARSFDDMHEAVRRPGPYAPGKGWRLGDAANLEEAGRELQALARSRGHEITSTPAEARRHPGPTARSSTRWRWHPSCCRSLRPRWPWPTWPTASANGAGPGD
jgi:hypothetical protein